MFKKLVRIITFMYQVIIVRTDLKMGKGKIAAQVAHAAVDAMNKTAKIAPAIVNQWVEQGQKKVVLKVSSEKKLIMIYKELEKHIPVVLIRDAGHTQLKPGTLTCIGAGPWHDNELEFLTKNLKLL